MKNEELNEKLKKWNGLRMVWIMLCAAFFILHSSFFISCSSIDCPVENVVATVYKLQKENGTADTLKDTLTVISRRINRTDTLLLDHVVNTTLFQLPMGYTNPEDTLLFIVNSNNSVYGDVVYIKKENNPHFESVDCNIAFFHTITDIRQSSHNLIDTIIINKRAVNYDLSTEHFQIVFKPADKRGQD